MFGNFSGSERQALGSGLWALGSGLWALGAGRWEVAEELGCRSRFERARLPAAP